MPRIVLSHWLVLNQSELLTFFDILPKVLNVLCNNPHIGLAGIESLFIWLSLRACKSICSNVQQMNWFPNNKISYQDEIHQKARVRHLRDSLQTEPFTVYGKWPKSAYLAACSQGSMSRRNLDFGEIFHRYGRRQERTRPILSSEKKKCRPIFPHPTQDPRKTRSNERPSSLYC